MENSSSAPASALSRRVFRGGALFFLAIKILWVTLPVRTMGLPRLGDDSINYLYRAKHNVFNYPAQQPAFKDIVGLWALNDKPSQETWYVRTRVAMQATDAKFSVQEWITALLLRCGLSLKTAWAAVEALTAAALCLGVALFLSALVGPAAAGLGMVLLSMAFFPQQGLNFMVPSVLALALALGVWATVLGSRPNWRWAALLSAAMTGVHPIGLYYAVLACALTVLLILETRDQARRRALLEALAAVTAATVAILLISKIFVPRPIKPYFGWYGMEAVFRNWQGVAGSLRYSLKNNWLVSVLALTGLAFFRDRVWNRRVACMAIVAAVFLPGSLLHFLEYPIELFDRVAAAMFIVVAGLAGAGLWCLVQSRSRLLRAAALAVTAGYLLLASYRWTREIFWNVNSRMEVINDQALEQRLSELPADSRVLYLDTFIVMPAALIKGGMRLHATAYPMLRATPSLKTELRRAKPDVVVTRVYRDLNAVAATGWHRGFDWACPRRHGFYLRGFEEVALRVPAGRRFYLRFDNKGAAFNVPVQGSGPCADISVPAKSRGWLEIPAACAKSGRVRLSLPDQAAWLTGFSTKAPVDRLAWPWGQESPSIVAVPRGRPAKAPVLDFGFSWKELFGEARAGEALRLLGRPLEALSDDSGFVFIKTGQTFH